MELVWSLPNSFLTSGEQVIACCRKPERAEVLNSLSKDYGGQLSIEQLDVTNEPQRQALAKQLGNQAIDLLINNAGIYKRDNSVSSGIALEDWQQSFAVNTIAPFQMVHELLPQLKAGDFKWVVNISSLMGSIADNQGGGSYTYRASKCALNMLCKNMSLETSTAEYWCG